LTQKAPYKGLGAESGEKREPVSDIALELLDSLKVLDPDGRLEKRTSAHGSKVPIPVVSRCSTRTRYSITSSAATSSLSGTVMPSILAVEALMTNSNLLDCTTGKSAGFAPLRMRPV